MNKDLRKVVILLAHPNMKESQANKALIEAVSDIEGVAVLIFTTSKMLLLMSMSGAKSFPTLPHLFINFLFIGWLHRHYSKDGRTKSLLFSPKPRQ